MNVLEHAEYDGHEQVVFFKDEKTGLKAIIAVHDTTLGPGVGGCRMWNYESEEAALNDVLRLSKGMTYKNAMAGLNFGGGKAVIIGNSKTQKSPELLKAYGRFVERLKGQYITAEDVGISPVDMEIVHSQTEHVAGLNGTSGDPSPFTALGVFEGIKASVKKRLQRSSLEGVKVAVQGLGHVGYYLCRHLFEAGAEIYACDINDESCNRVEKDFGAKIVETDEVYGLNVDVYSPCALGATVNHLTINEFRCSIVAGAANNQLQDATLGKELMDKGILYAPDYVINAGGIINISFEAGGYNPEKSWAKVTAIGNTLTELFNRAELQKRPTNEVADEMAKEILKGSKEELTC